MSSARDIINYQRVVEMVVPRIIVALAAHSAVVVDIGQELIELISTSTQYWGGMRVITSAPQLLDELLILRQ